MTDIALSVSALSVSFETAREPVHAVDAVDLTVARGETVGIVGESGSGKSTVARAVLGLTPFQSGEIRIHGEIVAPLRVGVSAPRKRAGHVQMIFQDSYSSLNPRLRPLDAVAEAVHVTQHVGARIARTRARDLLASVGLSDVQVATQVRALSGGQRQRVSIARALAADPSILVADEPTSSLDQSIAASLLNLLRHIQKQRGLSILFITHDLGVIRYLSDRVYVMRQGVVVESGRTSDVFGRPEQEYTRRLIASVPGLRPQGSSAIQTEAGYVPERGAQ